jgi:hypothetical protein
MSNRLTDAEWAAKADNEGLFYALTEYGLKSSDLVDQNGDLAEAVRRVEEHMNEFVEAYRDLEYTLGDIMDGDA